MSLLDLATARAHLRVESDYPADQIEPYLNAAELVAAQFMNRRVYADQNLLTDAVAAVPAALIAAGVAYGSAMADAVAIPDPVARCAAVDFASAQYRAAQIVSRETYAGIVLDDMIRAGILLILGHLFEQRQSVIVGNTVAVLPMGPQYVLQPYRIGMGV